MSGASHRPVPVEFDSSGERIRATVYGGSARPTPAVLICTGFSGTQDTPSIVAAAETFAAEGWIAMTFDYRGFGLSAGHPRQVVSVPRQLADIRAAIDPLIAGVVAQVPFNGFPKQSHREGQTMKGAYALLWAAIRDRVRGWFGRPPLYVKAVGREDELAVMVSPDANRTIEVLTSGTWRNQVAPRGLLDMMTYRPGRHASRIRAPLLVCVGAYDREAQGALTEPLARDAPRGELRSYPFAHFDIYRPEIRGRVLADQAAFLRRAFADR